MRKGRSFGRFAAVAATAAVTTALLAGLAGCASSQNPGGGKEDGPKIRTIKVAVAPGFYPITYADDNGNAAGYDVETFKAVDELLPEYEFVYELAEKETMNVGVQTGAYQVGINSMFKTAERQETYLLPENNMGYTAVGAVYREGEEKIASFQDIYDRKLKIYPTNASGGIKSVIDRWNEKHKDAQLSIELIPTLNNADGLNALRTGEYDAFIHLIPVYNLWDEEATAGLTVSDPLDAVPTFPIINKEETKLNDAINEALGTLKEDGTLSKLSREHFGYDVFEIGE